MRPKPSPTRSTNYERRSDNPETIGIIFDGPPIDESGGRYVEVEVNGKHASIGEWIAVRDMNRSDLRQDWWVLRFKAFLVPEDESS